MRFMAPTTNTPTICKAIGRAIEERNIRKKELALALGWDPSTVTRLLDGREPDLEVIGRIEKLLGMTKGRLLIDAGLVDVPNRVENMIDQDERFTGPWARMAKRQIQLCLDGSVEDKRSNAAPAESNERLMALSS